jgi:hypothetical protein
MDILTRNDTGIRGLGGTDIRRIVRGEALDLYLELTGRQEKEDLTWSQPVQIGRMLEPLVSRFYMHDTTNEVYSVAEAATCFPAIGDRLMVAEPGDKPDTLQHFAFDWALARPDGIVQRPDSTIKGVEFKAVNPFWEWPSLVQTYYPQIQWYLEVSGLDQWDFSAFLGNAQRRHSTIGRDPEYIADLLDQGERFWSWLSGGKPPSFVTMPIPAELAILGEKIVDMEAERNNVWANLAGTWLEAKHQADVWNRAEKTGNASLKALVPADASEVFGYGARIRRTRKGLTLTRMIED